LTVFLVRKKEPIPRETFLAAERRVHSYGVTTERARAKRFISREQASYEIYRLGIGEEWEVIERHE
jgi:hypothetical protein